MCEGTWGVAAAGGTTQGGGLSPACSQRCQKPGIWPPGQKALLQMKIACFVHAAFLGTITTKHRSLHQPLTWGILGPTTTLPVHVNNATGAMPVAKASLTHSLHLSLTALIFIYLKGRERIFHLVHCPNACNSQAETRSLTLDSIIFLKS